MKRSLPRIGHGMTNPVVNLDSYRTRGTAATPVPAPAADHPSMRRHLSGLERQIIEERSQRSFGAGLALIVTGLLIFAVHAVIDGRIDALGIVPPVLVAAGAITIWLGVRTRDRALSRRTTNGSH